MDLRPALAVETADIDQQRLVFGETEFGPQPLIAAARAELADLDAQRDDLDRIDPQRPQFRSAAILAEGENRIEPPIERTTIRIAHAAEQARN